MQHPTTTLSVRGLPQAFQNLEMFQSHCMLSLQRSLRQGLMFPLYSYRYYAEYIGSGQSNRQKPLELHNLIRPDRGRSTLELTRGTSVTCAVPALVHPSRRAGVPCRLYLAESVQGTPSLAITSIAYDYSILADRTHWLRP
ncbi:hypothetical protein AcV7_003536 [Taiwanofungus camphoratus]|nr:hypothetical protein AcV7_003536 [Antrodia cinnamomea]